MPEIAANEINMTCLVFTYQTTSATAVQISIAPKDSAVPVLADKCRTSIYNGSTVEAQTFDNTMISSLTVIDDIVYGQSQETHNMRIRRLPGKKV